MDRNKEKQEEKNIRESPQRRLEELERLRLQREREQTNKQRNQSVFCIFILHKLSEQIKFDI